MPRLVDLHNGSLLAAAAAVALIFSAAAMLAGNGTVTADVPSTYSSGSGGSRALYLLLQKSRPVERWQRPLADLPDGAGVTLVLAEPETAATVADRSALVRFLEQGGRVVTTGVSGSSFLPDGRVTPDPVGGLGWEQVHGVTPSPTTRAATTITLAPAAYWDDGSTAIPLYERSGRAYVVACPRQRGELLWLAAATPLTNAGVREPGNLEFALALVGDADRRILWDEYTHGYRDARSASLLVPSLWWGLLQLGLVAAAILLTYSRRHGPTLPADAESRTSPLEFVRTLGAVYRRAGAATVAIDAAYQRFMHGLAQRLGASASTPAEELLRAAENRFHDPELPALLRRCESARSDSRLSATTALELTRALWRCTERLELARRRRSSAALHRGD